jgi:hypothetical protein
MVRSAAAVADYRTRLSRAASDCLSIYGGAAHCCLRPRYLSDT